MCVMLQCFGAFIDNNDIGKLYSQFDTAARYIIYYNEDF